MAIEAKGTGTPASKDLKGMFALEEDLPLKKKIVVCLAEKPRLVDGHVEILPLRLFLEMLWAGKIV